MGEAQLFVLGGRAVGESIEFDGEVVLGRDASCALVLTDRSISRRHARVSYDGLQWSVEDLDSRNGLRIDGERVERAILHDGDEFVLGDVPLRFRVTAAIAAAPATAPAELPELGEEILLEEDPDPVPAAPPSPAPTAQAVPSAPREQPHDAPPPSRADSRGLLRGDLSQQPGWVRLVVVLLALALVAVLAWLAFQAVTQVRSTL